MNCSATIIALLSRQPHLTLLLCLVVAVASCKKDPENDSSTAPVNTDNTETSSSLPVDKLDVAGETFNIELAFTRASRTRGLMFRRELASNRGMLFIFDKSRLRSFYMKNCLIDLDAVFIKDSGEITAVATMTVPVPGRALRTYSSGAPVKYVLELPAGTARRLDLYPGRMITIPARIQNIIPDPG